MITQKVRVENIVTESTTMENKIHSKESIKQFTKLFIENILYQRNLINHSSFTDYVFQGVALKKLKDNVNHKLAKHLAIYFEGVEDAIDKGYLRELIFRLCRKGDSDNSLEEYYLGLTYFPDDSPKLYDLTKTSHSLKTITNNLRYCVNRYFDPLPPLAEIDLFIYMTFYDEKTPKDYVAPHFLESNGNIKHNDDKAVCSLGSFRTPFIKLRSKMEGFATNQSDHEETQECDSNGTQSISDSQEETIIIPDDD